MDPTPFTLECSPARETRRDRAKREAIEQANRTQAERTRVARQAEDHEAFRARAWLVMAGEEFVDFRDPAEGFTLESTLDELAARFTQGPDYWLGRDVSVWLAGRLVGAITGDVNGEAVITRFDRTHATAGDGPSAPDEQPATPLPLWIDPGEAAEMVGGFEILDAMAERVDLSARVFYLRSEIASLAHQPTRTRLSRAHGGTKARKA